MEEHWIYEDGEKRRLKPFHGILLFLAVMVSFYTIIAWAQMKWGMYGLALTELYLLALSVLAAKFTGSSLREIFPVKRPQWKKIFAVFLMWGSSYALLIPITMMMAWLFPKQMFSVSGDLNSFITSVPPLVSVFISCVMPAVCEEAMHRGFILKSFQTKWKNPWILCGAMGILFGLFHGSIWRFLPTALLGGVLTYLMVKTENMIYPALFHFINNFMPGLLAGSSGTSAQTEQVTAVLIQNGFPLVFLGIYIAMACVVPFGFYTGAYLLRKGEEGKIQKYLTSDKALVFLVVLTVLPILLGMFVFFYGIFFENFSILS